MCRGKRRFGEEFKRDAVRLVVEEGYTLQGGRGGGGRERAEPAGLACQVRPRPEPCGENATLEELREENQRLRKQLRRAELEREILKKATAYFAKESL